jgi:hypothetical protein
MLHPLGFCRLRCPIRASRGTATENKMMVAMLDSLPTASLWLV